MAAITDSTILTNTTDFLIDTLAAAITDPVASTRTAKVPNSTFVSVKSVGVPLLYPCITVQVTNVQSSLPLGMQTEAYFYTITAEIEVYAKKRVYDADRYAELVIDAIRTYQYGAASANVNNLYTPVILSVIPFSFEQSFGTGGMEMIHKRMITVRYNYVTGGSN